MSKYIIIIRIDLIKIYIINKNNIRLLIITKNKMCTLLTIYICKRLTYTKTLNIMYRTTRCKRERQKEDNL